ncbi:MAG: glycosyltransferase family 2 protein [Cyanobacteria bacterium J069]|nr:MAG: glycosyltransferase family 2 protein [Cyanobacteria bacterium J069]
MPQQSWYDDDAYDELGPIHAIVSDLSDADDPQTQFYRGLAGRRGKAALAMMVVWSSTIALHLVSWGAWVVYGLTALMSVHILRLMAARPRPLPHPLTTDNPDELPFVSLMVAAKNEEGVIGPLVRTLCDIDYPASRYELWVVDDHSTDRTPQVLEKLKGEYSQLKVLRRGAEASGGKSGALNQVCALAQGEIFGVFDADAQVPADLLRRVLPLFQAARVGAVQVRKAIAQVGSHPDAGNFLIQGQTAEMALDAYYQQHRIAVGGIGELRGNGQFVRRAALERCGAWNEETITDDLDLTIRLHLDGWDIDFLPMPAVQEQGVTRLGGLWHQRNRWAEGGYQRYLDYWRWIVRNRMGTRKTIDLLTFFMFQYIMPTAALPDLLMAIARNRLPIFGPLTGFTLVMSMVGMMVGLRRFQTRAEAKAELEDVRRGRAYPGLLILLQTLRGAIYMLHWFAVVASTTARMSIRPKRLKWVKTVHHGSDDLWLEEG